MRALGRNVLGELGQEIQRRQDQEIPRGTGREPVVLRVGEGWDVSMTDDELLSALLELNLRQT